MPCRFLIAVLLALSLCVPLALAQRQPAAQSGARLELAGWVRYADSSAPAEVVQVDLYTFNGQLVATTYTNTSGAFEFRGLTSGVYSVRVELKDYEPVRESVELVNSSRRGLQLFVSKSLSVAAEAPGGATVDVRELSLPRPARAAFERGIERLQRRRDPQGSLAQFQRALKEFPGYYEAEHAMGIAYLQMGRNAEAEEAFRRALRISEDGYAPAYVSLAALRSNAGRPEEAAGLARQALELAPDSWEGHFELGRALLNLDLIPQAEVSLREAQRRRPEFPELYLLYANLCIRKQDLSGLIISLEEYLRLDPHGAHAENARATLERARHQARKSPPAARP
jgi:tetratricopeptide (TPR) repeat protein